MPDIYLRDYTILIYSVWPCDHDTFDRFSILVLISGCHDREEISVDFVIELVDSWVTLTNMPAAKGHNEPGEKKLLSIGQKVVFSDQILLKLPIIMWPSALLAGASVNHANDHISVSVGTPVTCD